MQAKHSYLTVAFVALAVGVFSWANPFVLTEPDVLRALAQRTLEPYFLFALPSVLVHWLSSVWPDAPVVFRVLTTGLHAVVAVGVYQLVLMMFRRLLGREEKWPALVGAVMFAVLPIHVGTVMTVIGLPVLLASALLVWSLALYFSKGPGSRSARMGLSFALFIGAIFSHPFALAMPVVLLITEAIIPAKNTVWSRNAAMVAPFVAAAVGIMVFWREPFLTSAGDAKFDVLAMQWNLVRGLLLSVFPLGLAVDHATGEPLSMFVVVLSFLSLLGALGLVLWLFRLRVPVAKVILVGVLAVFAFGWSQNLLLPRAEFEELRAYLPGVALALACSGLWFWLREAAVQAHLRQSIFAGTVIILSVMGSISVARERIFSSERSIWEEVVRVHPRHQGALRALALEAFKRQDFDGAAKLLQALHDLAPGDVSVMTDLALVLSRLPSAENDARQLNLLLKATAANPKDSAAIAALANFYLAKDLRGEASGALKRLVELEPDNKIARSRYEALKASLEPVSVVEPEKPAPPVKKEVGVKPARAKRPVSSPATGAAAVAQVPTPAPTAVPTPSGPATHQIDCDSWAYAYQRCDVQGQILSAEVIQQRSERRGEGRGECVKDSTWGFEHGYLWVKGGCRAKFQITVQ